MSTDERERGVLTSYLRALLPRRDLDSDFLDVLRSRRREPKPSEIFTEQTGEWRMVDGEFAYVELSGKEREAIRKDHSDEFEPQLEAQRQAARDRLTAKHGTALASGDSAFDLKIAHYKRLADVAFAERPTKAALVASLAVMTAEILHYRLNREPYFLDVQKALGRDLESLRHAERKKYPKKWLHC